MLKLLVLVAKGVPSDGGEYGAFRFIGFRFTKYLLVFFARMFQLERERKNLQLLYLHEAVSLPLNRI